MDKKTRAIYEARAKVFKAMAHSTRLFIIDVLSREEHCVGELTEMVGADVSTISRHLSVLKNAGIVSDNKHGAQVFYKLCLPCVLGFISCLESTSMSATCDCLASAK